MKLPVFTTLLLCLLAAAACTSTNTHGVNTHNQTIPVYSQKF